MGCSILIVDDSKITRQVMRKTLSALLETAGPNIQEAEGGEQAIAACRTHDFDYVFLDLTMPGTSGFDVLATLGQAPLSTKFFVMSADVQPKAKERVFLLGAAAFLSKPPNREALRQLLVDHGILEGGPS